MHNPSMTRVFPAIAWSLLLALLAGCAERDPFDPGEERVDASTPAPQHLAWRGVLACADCDGIDTHLTLERAGRPPRYRLLETYLLADTGERFHEEGAWRREGTLLRLQSDAGAPRTFAIESDGALTVRDRRGRPVPRGSRLVPVEPHER